MEDKKQNSGLSYKDAGVDYDPVDGFKRKALEASCATAFNMDSFPGLSEVGWSRGESAYIFRRGSQYWAQVNEGLGTKNLVAEAMYKLDPKNVHCFANISQCTLAMIVNDLITVGALPKAVNMNLAVGDSDWFKDEARYTALIEGWRQACNLADCSWGGGETPVLKGLIYPETMVLSGSGTGPIPDDKVIDSRNTKAGDSIIFLQSSGIHANGLSLARLVADQKLAGGYLTELPDGRTYGESLLDATHIYVDAINALQKAEIDIHAAINLTGHGYRKLMRPSLNLRYVVSHLFEPQPVFDCIQKYGVVKETDMYSTFNMGTGFAIYLSATDAASALEVLDGADLPYGVKWAGYIEESEKPEVVLQELDITFEAETLQIR